MGFKNCVCILFLIFNTAYGLIRPNDTSPLPPVYDCFGVNEVWSKCASPCNTCEVARGEASCNFLVCNEGCDCMDGYHRNEQNVCVSKEECYGVCSDPNAEYNDCGDTCPVTCNNKDKHPGKCLDVCYKRGGCRCKAGFVKNIDGKCIKPEECPKCEENEVYRRLPPCDARCSDLRSKCDAREPSCCCVDGYARDENNKCVPIKECPPKQCPANEVYNPCPIPCPREQTCVDRIDDGQVGTSCPTDLETRECVPRCECKTGMVRLYSDGPCVDEFNCCNDTNAEYVRCPLSCKGGTCDQPEVSSCAPFCPAPGCQCKPGYIKDAEGKCVEPSDCPPKKCGVNEWWNAYPGFCKFEETCESALQDYIRDCTTPRPGEPRYKPRCECLNGYVRHNGTCVSNAICCKDLNAEAVSCPYPCDGTCEVLPAPGCQVQCRYMGCKCERGFVKDPNGRCVNPKDCIQGCPGPNEIRVRCKDPCPMTCEMVATGQPKPICRPRLPCPWGCDCLPGFVRNDQGICVKPEECPKKCGPNEWWNPCPGACQIEESCITALDPSPRECVQPAGDLRICRPRCECLKGYIRVNNTCVLPGICCKDPNAEPVPCPYPCDGTCDTFPAADCLVHCRFLGCKCKPGYVKDPNGRCILRRDCRICPKPNTVFNQCGSRCPPTCDNRTPTCIQVCVPGCYCIEGYILHNGECIPIEKCPCTGPNEVAVRCKDPCPETCDMVINNLPKPNCLPQFPCPSGCNCLPGYVRNSQNVCVRREECLICGANERLNLCPGYCTFDKTCPELLHGLIRDCPRPPPDWRCRPRCECLPGYVRINNQCVPEAQCCPNPNEVLTDCPYPCDNCFNRLPDCMVNCRYKGCRCRRGTLRNRFGVCVPVRQCIRDIPIDPIDPVDPREMEGLTAV